MRLGIPRGFFYYDYISFMRRLFSGTGVEIVVGGENDDRILAEGNRLTVDEACFPIKLFVGQASALTEKCDRVLIPRVMKDCNGRWLCPKLLGIPELSLRIPHQEKLLITDPVYFDNRSKAKRVFRKMFRELNAGKDRFDFNFDNAYGRQLCMAAGMEKAYIEAGWEFMPEPAGDGEIVLPNTKQVLLLGHCYNVYDRFANCGIMEKLEELAIGTVTETAVNAARREAVVKEIGLDKKPFWEAFVRNVGTAVELKDKVDGIIYLSSFSCGPDAFIYQMIKKYVKGTPVMLLKLDEHRGEAGFDTRIEAFADLLERRRYS